MSRCKVTGRRTAVATLTLCLAAAALRGQEPAEGSVERPAASTAQPPEGIPKPALQPQGRTCIEPTGLPDPAHPSHIRRSFVNQYGCKIPLRTGDTDFGYNHIVHRAAEQVAQGRANSHEVTPFAQRLWESAIGRAGGTLLINNGYFVASVEYRTSQAENRTMCVFFDTKDLKHRGNYYKVKGIVTAYWIEGHSEWPSISCRDARE